MPRILTPGYTDTYKNIPWYYNLPIVCPRCAEIFTLYESDFVQTNTFAGDVPSDTQHSLNWVKYDWSGVANGNKFDPMYIKGLCYNCGYWPIVKNSPHSSEIPGTDTNYPLFIFIPPATYSIAQTQFIARTVETGIEIMIALYMKADNTLYSTNDTEGRVYVMAQRYSGTTILPQLYDAGIGFNPATSYRELSLDEATLIDSFFVQFMQLHGILLVE